MQRRCKQSCDQQQRCGASHGEPLAGALECARSVSPACASCPRRACSLRTARRAPRALITSSMRSKRPVAGALVHFAQDRVRRIAAVHAHDLGGERQPHRSYAASAATDRDASERIGERARVEDRLPGAVRAARIHRVRGVAEQRDAALRPARQRILVDHRKLEDRFGARIIAGTSSQSKCQSSNAPMKSSRRRAGSSRAACAAASRSRRPS